MNTQEEKNGSSAFKKVDVTTIIILFFLSVVIAYYAMLQHEMKQRIIVNIELTATKSAEQINKYLSTGIDILTLASHTLDDMIRDGRPQKEILDFLVNQSAAIVNITSGKSTGIYAVIGNDFLDGTGFDTGDGFVPSSRPWYIGAKANIGRVAVIDPYLDVHTNTTMITLAKTLCDVKSVAALDFSMEHLQALTEEINARNHTDMEIVLDRKYKVIAHSDRSKIGQSYISEKGTFGSTLIEKLRSSNENFFSFRFGGSDYIVYTMPVANNWLCLSVFDTTSAFATLRKIFILTIIVSCLVITVLSLIIGHSNKKARLAQEFNEKAERAAAANEAKSSFLSNMSHEIRTPINAVLGMNEMILRESEEPNILEYSENIRAAGTTLLGLINDILDFSKIEAGKMDIIPVDYDLSSVINDLVTMIQARTDKKGLVLKLDFDGNIPKMLNGDEVRIKQVVTNILTNAVKYTEKGSVTFRIGYERIADNPDGVFLNFSVADTGIGIKPEDMAKLFSEFERIEEKRNRNIEGTGLGMNITKRLLEMMGTSLKVESVYGEGSTFSFRLQQKVIKWDPLGDYEAAHRASLLSMKKYKEKFTAPDARVLVVDDTPMNLTVFKGLLKRTRVRIDTADSGSKALELAQAKKYDVIFLDHMMPNMDGIETLQRLRVETEGPNIKTPSICLTANAISGAREEYLAVGFDDYLTKPIDAVKLEEMMIRYLPPEKILAADSDVDLEHKPELPEWLYGIDELDVEAGLKHCGDEEAYLDTLKIYGSYSATGADEIAGFWRARDIKNTTVKVHALKSTSRAIGAESLGTLAEKLELAGKSGDEAVLDADLAGLLERYRALGTVLSPLYSPAGNAQDEEDLPLISENELQEAYSSIRECVLSLDAEGVLYVLDYLNGFRLSESEKQRAGQLRDAVNNFDWDSVNEILA
ncbi:MAG: response regulator [Synergistaceae bacterium]|nr:response regulator [Synergistaceae bacterium]